MEEPIYTKQQIDSAWKEYKETMVLRGLKDGKKVVLPLSAGANLEGFTSAQMIKLSSVMSFPKFLEKEHA